MKPAQKRAQVKRRRFLSLLAALCLLLSGLASIHVETAAPARADVGTPSWWGGKVCDTNNYPGSYALGASFNGVYACGPGSYNQGGTDTLERFYSGAWGEYEWECVELVMRYMYLVYGIAPYNAPGGKDVYGNYPATGGTLSKVPNDGASLPLPGDIISVGAAPVNPKTGTSPNPYGHTAVVTNVSVDGNGNGTLTDMQQNATSNGVGTLTIAGWKITGTVLGGTVIGWLHNPNGGTTGGTTPTYVPSVAKPVVYTVGTTQYIDVYAVASDQYVYGNTWNGVSWTTQSTKAGCCFQRNPTPVTYQVGGTSYIDLYATNLSNGHVYRNTWNGTSWAGMNWQDIGCCFWSDPAAVSYTVGGTSYIDVYATSNNGHMYRKMWNGVSWTGSFDMGCCFTNHAPTAMTYTVGGTAYVDVYATNSSGQIYRDLWNGSTWTGFTYLNCCFWSDPAVVAYTVGSTQYIDVYANSSDSHMYRDVWNGTSWSGSLDMGCCFTNHTPTAVTYTVGGTAYIDLYTLGSDTSLYFNRWNGSTWNSQFTPFGCCFASDPNAVVLAGSTSQVEVFANGKDITIYYYLWDGSTWSYPSRRVNCCFDHVSP